MSFFSHVWNPLFGMVNIEAEHPMPGLDKLVANLEDQHPTSWDIAKSSEEFIQEIMLADYIQAMLMDPEEGVIPAPRPTMPLTTGRWSL